MNKKETITKLYQRYLQDDLHAEELMTFLQLVEDPANQPILQELIGQSFQDFQTQTSLSDSEEAFSRFKHQVLQQPAPDLLPIRTRKPSYLKWLPYAAVLLLGLGFTWLFFQQKQGVETKQLANQTQQMDIAAGATHAILTSGDGAPIALDSNSMLELASNQVLLNKDTLQRFHKVVWHTLETPRASEYKLTLPDGSRVHLNAGSKLHFPSAFSGSIREVRLEGEAYFEVAHQANQPFQVLSANQQIEVLGTSFNVSAYAEEALRTTLVSGKVAVKTPIGELFLNPGQQAVWAKGQLSKADVDVEEAIAWAQSRIVFSKKNLQQITKQLERWYDVDFVFADNLQDLKTKTFSGNIARSSSLAEVLNIFTLNHSINYKIEGRKVYVLKTTKH